VGSDQVKIYDGIAGNSFLICKIRPTSACTRPPTALFFKGHAPAKALVIEACLAGPVSGDARR
jgi:hypothetical protein